MTTLTGTRLPFGSWLTQQTARDDRVGDLARAVTFPHQSDTLDAKSVRRLPKRFHPEHLEPHVSGSLARALRTAITEWKDGASDESPAVVVRYIPAQGSRPHMVEVVCPFCHETDRAHRRSDRPTIHTHGLGGPDHDPRELLSHRAAHCFDRSRYLPSGYNLVDAQSLVPSLAAAAS